MNCRYFRRGVYDFSGIRSLVDVGGGRGRLGLPATIMPPLMEGTAIRPWRLRESMIDLVGMDAPIDTSRYRWHLVAATPFALAVPLLTALVLRRYDVELRPTATLAGAGGWLLAMALRVPVRMAAQKLAKGPDGPQTWIVASSGPMEEGARLLILTLVGPTFSRALSVALGWATVEVVYSLLSGYTLLSVLGRDDEKGKELRSYIAAQPRSPSPLDPWWGVVERVSATFIHLGLTLLVAFNSGLALVTAVVHSGTNLIVTRASRSRSVATFELCGLVWGVVVLAVGLLIWRQ
jgi:hypothetical protein